MAIDLGADRILVAEQDEAEIVATRMRPRGAGDHDGRAGITAHGVDGYSRPATHPYRLQ
jgi:hypothetical protein